jgi:hypothetical protein
VAEKLQTQRVEDEAEQEAKRMEWEAKIERAREKRQEHLRNRKLTM